MMTSLIAGCANINALTGGCEWIRPIILGEDDRLTTAIKRALLAHNEMDEEFCLQTEMIDAWGMNYLRAIAVCAIVVVIRSE